MHADMNNMPSKKVKVNMKYIHPKDRRLLTHKGIIAGKLKGQIPAQTPSGSLIL